MAQMSLGTQHDEESRSELAWFRHEATRALCETHQMNAEDVNRALLRTLASLRLQFD